MSGQLIVDASVTAKWFFPSEENSREALKLKDDFAKRQVLIVVPDLIYYEVNNIFNTAVVNSRLDRSDAKRLFQRFLEFEMTVYSLKELMELMLEFSIEHKISSYDGAYLALSKHLNVPFITADREFLNKVPDGLILDIADYK